MKKLLGFAMVTAAVFVLSGCAGEGSDDEGVMSIHYLTDVNGIGIPDVRYDCTSNSAVTGIDGDYAFDSTGDNCTFILDSHLVDTAQGLYINSSPNDATSGVDGIFYTCLNYDTSANPHTGDTIGQGHFNHVFNYDECTFRY